jgi:ribosome maturation factor RimP
MNLGHRMTDQELSSSLWAIIEPILEPEGMELIEIEFKPEGSRWVLRLYVDAPGGVTLDDCELVSRQVSALLDIKDPIDRSYTLEVSSPGINRVLRREKDFRSFAGSPVRLKTRRKIDGQRNFRGTLKGMENSRIILEVDGNRVEINPEDLEKARLDLPDTELFRQDLRKRPGMTGD